MRDRTKVHLYGRWESHRSLPKVARNIARVLAGHFHVSIWSTDMPWAFPDRVPPTGEVFRVGHTAARRHRLYQDLPGGVDVDLKSRRDVIATSFVYPDDLLSGWMKMHRVTYPGFVCEAMEILNQWEVEANKHTACWVPSRYCKDAFERSGVRRPLYVIHHGIEPEFRPLETPRKPSRMTFLLLNTVAHFHYRKGVLDGLRAFKDAFPNGKADVQLLLRSPLEEKGLRAAVEEEVARPGAPIVVQEPKAFSVPAEAMNGLYNGVHALFAPSRGEGFGLPTLEAKAAGIPVVGTFWHGSREHFMPELDLEIGPHPARLCHIPISEEESGIARDLDHDGMVAALRKMYDEYDERSRKSIAAAPDIRREWGWTKVLKPLVSLIRTGKPT